jgi:NADH:ubiquinone oxidoreductase subunit 6 (subunit J)
MELQDILFIFCALVSLAGTVILLSQRNAVYALLGLLLAFLGSAGIFQALDAPFVAVSQVLIYAGALAVLFLFVLMFTDTRTSEDRKGLPRAVGSRANFDPAEFDAQTKKKRRKEGELPSALQAALDSIVLPKPLALVVALGFLLCFSFAIFKLPAQYDEFGPLPESYATGLYLPADEGAAPGTPATERVVEYGTTEAVSFTIFEGFPLAFEFVSLLIFAAVLGAVLLARRHLAPAPKAPEASAAAGHGAGHAGH